MPTMSQIIPDFLGYRLQGLDLEISFGQFQQIGFNLFPILLCSSRRILLQLHTSIEENQAALYLDLMPFALTGMAEYTLPALYCSRHLSAQFRRRGNLPVRISIRIESRFSQGRYPAKIPH